MNGEGFLHGGRLIAAMLPMDSGIKVPAFQSELQLQREIGRMSSTEILMAEYEMIVSPSGSPAPTLYGFQPPGFSTRALARVLCRRFSCFAFFDDR